MKKFLLISLLFIQFGLKAQSTASFMASVSIVERVKITTLKDLNFSHLRAGTGGVVTLAADGLRNGPGGLALGEGGNISPAALRISGKPGTKVHFQTTPGGTSA